MYRSPLELLNLKPEEILDYLRKSQSDDPRLTVEEVLTNHEKILDAWTEKHFGVKVPESNKFREVVSGEKLKERPEINKVLRLIESPKYKAIKVVDPQRLTRGDLEDIGRLMKLLKLTNTVIIVPDERGYGERIYDLRDEYDWNAFEAELKRGNDYLNYYKKIQNRGRILSVSMGNYIGSIPPYGFNKTWVMDGKRKCPTLEENKEEADVVRMIFDLYVNKDMGRPSICYHLDGLGIKPPKGQRWSPAALKDMLENVHYIGKVKWNWRKTISIVEEGEIIETRPKARVGEYLIYDGRHDGIISEELFNAARAKQGKNHRAKATTKVRNPFAGLVYCRCGRAMSLRYYKKKDGTERSPARLLCDDQAHCQTGSCLFDEMIDRVSAILEQCISDFETRINSDDGDSAKLHASLIKRLEAKRDELNKKEIAQWEKYTEEGMPKHIFESLNEKVLKEKEEVQQALCKAYESMPDPVDYTEKLTTFREALAALHNPDMDAERKNALLKKCIDRIDYSREKPQRLKRTTPKRRITVNGKRKVDSNLKTGANWSTEPFDIEVKLRV